MITLLLHLLRLSRGAAPAGGSPYYILPAKIPELTRPEDAVLVEAELSRGGDFVKLFTGSWATPSSIVVMPVDVVRAAVEVGHRRRKLVFAHPSNSPGARAAIEGGVDVLDRKSTRLNSSHGYISYAVFCLKKKKENRVRLILRYTQSHRARPR